MTSIRIGIGTPPSWHEIDGADDVVGYDVDGSVEGMKEGIVVGYDDVDGSVEGMKEEDGMDEGIVDGFDDGADDVVGRYEIEGFDDGVDDHNDVKGSQMG